MADVELVTHREVPNRQMLANLGFEQNSQEMAWSSCLVALRFLQQVADPAVA